jgi:hypothetical protein
MTSVKVDVDGIVDAYLLLDKLKEAGYDKSDYTWEYKNHIRSFCFDTEPAEPRHVIFNFVDPAVACWFRLLV